MTLSTFEFYIYKPQAATNLCTNPSFESSTTSWEVFNATAALNTDHQRRGARSLAVAVTSDTEGGAYYAIALETSTEYTFSADVETIDGLTYRIYFTDASSADVGTPVSWTGNGHWQRRAVTYTTTGAETFHARVSCTTANTSADSFYLDGVQIEAGSETTYLDGDMTGFVVGQTDFGWNGTAHASTSWRSGQTRKGGTRVRVKDYLPAITVLGLGMPPIINQAQPHTLGGSYYQNTIASDRSFSILGELNGSSPGAFLTLRDALVDAVNHNQTTVPQPLVLEWQGLDSSSNEAADTCLIECHYSGGLEGNWQEFGYEQIPLQFQAFSPYVLSGGEHSTVLGYTTTVDSFSDIGYRDTDGQWKAMGTGCNGIVRAIAVASDGTIYIGGSFTLAGGVANTAYIAKWNGTAFEPLGTGMNNGVYALAIAPDGALYAGGVFTLADGVANTARIAKWNGTAWSALGTGIGSGGVNALAFDNTGNLYIGGAFLNHGDANGDWITKWDGAAYSSLGTGMAGGELGNVTEIAVAQDGRVYVGGGFATGNGVTLNGIGYWNGTTFVAMGTGIAGTLWSVNALAVDERGNVFIGGRFDTVNGSEITNIAMFNGSNWSALGAGLDDTAFTIAIASDGTIYVGGYFTTAGGITMPDRIARWNGSTWLPLDVNVQDAAAYVYAIDFDKRERLYMGGQWAGSTALSATVTTPSIGTALAYPKFNLTGPGKLWQFKNYTTGRSIFFNNLTLLAGETAVLDLNPERITFTSSWRGNLLNYILSGSNLDFPLVPGDNNISAYMTGTTAASAITMIYRDRYLSLDGAVY